MEKPKKLRFAVGGLLLIALLTAIYSDPWGDGSDPEVRPEVLRMGAPYDTEKRADTASVPEPTNSNHNEGTTERREAETGQSSVVQFLDSDGINLGHVGVRTVERPSLHVRYISQTQPSWSFETNGDGELWLGEEEGLGQTIAVRVNENWTEIVPFDVGVQREVRIAAPVDQEIHLIVPDVEGHSVQVALSIHSTALTNYVGGQSIARQTGKGPFVDTYSPQVERVREKESLVLCHVVLSAKQRTQTIHVPPGSYRVDVLRSSIGWWYSGHELIVDGSPIRVQPYRVPIVNLLLPHSNGSTAKAPQSISVRREIPAGEHAASGSTLNVPFELENGVARVSMNCLVDDVRTLYSFEVTWRDGGITRTKAAEWVEMSGTVDLSLESP